MVDALDALRYGSKVRQPKQQEQEQEKPVPLKPDEPKGNPVFSALVGAANLLDTPGSVVRDLVTLLPGGTKPQNPFDQLVRPFSSDNRVGSRDIMRDYRMIGKNNTWGNFTAGLAADIVTDPLSWATTGLTGAGKAVATQGGEAVSKAGLNKMAQEVAKHQGRGVVDSSLTGMRSAVSNAKSRVFDAMRKKPKVDPAVESEAAEAAADAVKREVTEREARSLATPRGFTTSAYEKAKEFFLDKAKGEADRLRDELPPDIEDIAEFYARGVAKGLDKRMRQGYSGKSFDDSLDVSIGGMGMFNVPFGTRGVQRGLPNLVNKLFDKEMFIDGVFKARRYKPSDEHLRLYDDIVKNGPDLSDSDLDEFVDGFVNKMRGGAKKPPKPKASVANHVIDQLIDDIAAGKHVDETGAVKQEYVGPLRQYAEDMQKRETSRAKHHDIANSWKDSDDELLNKAHADLIEPLQRGESVVVSSLKNPERDIVIEPHVKGFVKATNHDGRHRIMPVSALRRYSKKVEVPEGQASTVVEPPKSVDVPSQVVPDVEIPSSNQVTEPIVSPDVPKVAPVVSDDVKKGIEDWYSKASQIRMSDPIQQQELQDAIADVVVKGMEKVDTKKPDETIDSFLGKMLPNTVHENVRKALNAGRKVKTVSGEAENAVTGSKLFDDVAGGSDSPSKAIDDSDGLNELMGIVSGLKHGNEITDAYMRIPDATVESVLSDLKSSGLDITRGDVLAYRKAIDEYKGGGLLRKKAEKAPVVADEAAKQLDVLDEYNHPWRQDVADAWMEESIAPLREKHSALQKAIDDLGPAPVKPSNEARRFGTNGREGAPPEAVAQYDAEVKAYNSWNRKYSKLKKQEVDASNDLFHSEEMARQHIDKARNALSALAEVRGGSEEDIDIARRLLDALDKADGVKPGTWMDDIQVQKAKASDVIGDDALNQAGKNDQTVTPQFKGWFGDWEKDPAKASKVVDAEGKPLVVYHGTDGDFSVFKTLSPRELGAHFGTVDQANDIVVSKHMRVIPEVYGDPSNIKPTYLNIRNPARLVDTGHWGARDMQAAISKDGVAGVDDGVRNAVQKASDDEWVYFNKLMNGPAFGVYGPDGVKIEARSYGLRQLYHYLQDAGYDGVVYKNTNEGDSAADSYIAFHSNQIKSATGNSGAFDPSNPSILHQSNGVKQAPRGAMQVKDGKALVYLFENADRSTFIHEVAHIARRRLGPELLAKAEKAYGVSGGNWERAQEEEFAKAFEQYMMDGKSPIPELKNVFQKMRDWLVEVYKSVRGTKLLNDERRALFDEMLTPGGNKGAKRGSGDGSLFQEAMDAGTDASTKAAARKEWLSNGVRSSFFKRWFGDWENDPANASKVVDAEGKPLVVYHGTRNGFDTFSRSRYTESSKHSSSWLGFFFSTPRVADLFTQNVDRTSWPLKVLHETGANLMPVYLNIKNPYVMTGKEFSDRFVRGVLNKPGVSASGDALKFKIKLVTDGYDGLHIKKDGSLAESFGGEEFVDDTFVAFDPNQIKSATGNSGEFDPSNPSILFQASLRPDSIPNDKSFAVLKAWSEAEKAIGESPVGRMIKYAFHAPAMGMLTKLNQANASKAYEARKEAVVKARTQLAPFAQVWQRTDGLDERKVTAALKKLDGYKDLGERDLLIAARGLVNRNVNELIRYMEGFTDEIPNLGHTGKDLELWRKSVQTLRKMFGGWDKTAKEYAAEMNISIEDAREILNGDVYNPVGMVGDEYDNGILINPLVDKYIKKYFPRYGATLPPQSLSKDFRSFLDRKRMENTVEENGGMLDPYRDYLLNDSHPSVKQRKVAISDVPGGTAMVNIMSVDPKIAGIAHTLRVTDGNIPEDVMDDMVNHVVSLGQNESHPYSAWVVAKEGEEDAELIAQQRDLYAKLAQTLKFLANAPRQHVIDNVQFFSGDLFTNALFRVQAHEQTKAVARIIYGMIRDGAKKRRVIEPFNISDFAVKDQPKYERGLEHYTIEHFIRAGKKDSIAARQKIIRSLPKEDVDSIRNGIIDARVAMLRESKPVYYRDSYGSVHKFTPELDNNVPTGVVLYTKKGDEELNKSYGLKSSPKNKYVNGAIVPVKRKQDGKVVSNFPVRLTQEEAEEMLDASDAEILNNFTLPRKDVDELLKVINPPQMSESARMVISAWDKYTTLWKSLHTGVMPFVSFHARNRGSGAFANMTTEASIGDPTQSWWNPMRYIKPSVDSRLMYQYGKHLEDLNSLDPVKRAKASEWIDKAASKIGIENIPSLREASYNADGTLKSARERMDLLQQLGFSHEIIGGKQGVAAEQLGHNKDAVANQLPGALPTISKPPVGTGKLASLFDMTRQKGLRGEETAWWPALLGQDMSRYVEHQNRFAPFLSLLKNGYSPEEAARIVKKAQVDYTEATPFERDVLRRVFPFYSFSSGAMRHYGQNLLDHPGGLTAQTIRAANSSRDRDALAPEHIMETVAVPLGKSGDGTDNYITGFGLGFEDPLAIASPALAGRPDEVSRELISRSNPLIKALVEGSTGVSTFQRGPFGARYLEDMDPTVGRTIANVHDLLTGDKTEKANPFISGSTEFAIENSPLSRYTGLARTITDPRKYENPLYLLSNLLTGVKVNQVSPGAQDAIERGRIAREIKDMGGRNFEMPYFPEYSKESFDDQEEIRSEELLARLKELTRRGKERRLAQEAAKGR